MNAPDPIQAYLANFAQEDEILRWIQSEAERHGLPTISLQPLEGKLLHLLVKVSGAKKIVEIGALGGYSGTWLARALPTDGQLWTLEKSATHAGVARAAFEKAGLSNIVTLLEGDALPSLQTLATHAPFDFVFMDADPENYVNYLQWVRSHLRAGGILVAHNALAGGNIAAPINARSHGMAAFQEGLLADPHFDSTIIPWGDGIVFAVKRT
jgi:caffeoyl-CoA O-methyltransferase